MFSYPRKSHRMAFNMALSWKWSQHVLTCHFSLYFFHLFFSQKHLIVIVFSCFVQFLSCLGGCGSYFFIRRAKDISHTPRIISSLVVTPQNGIQHGFLLEGVPTCPSLACFPLFLPSSFQQEAFGCDCFFHVLSSFWLGGCGSYLGISHTPGIISSLVEIPQNGIQHGSFLEVFLSFIIPYFFHIHVETCEFFFANSPG